MRKNVWILNHYATNMFFDQGGRHHWFAKYLRKKGYNPTIFCANTFHTSEDIIEIDKTYKFDVSEEIPYVFVKTSSSKGNGIDRVKNMVLFYINLKKTLKELIKFEGKPDVILASSVHPLTLVAGIQIAKKYNIKIISEVRDLWPEAIFAYDKSKENSLLGKALIYGENWIYRKSDSIIFTKEGDKDYLLEKKWTTQQGGKIDLNNVHYINNGVDLENYDLSIQKNILKDSELDDSSKFKVIYVGAIRPVNNVGNIVEAAKILEKESNIQFIVYGDGIELNNLRKKVNDENISNIVFKGFVNKKYIPNILSRSDLNILNYSSESYNWSRGNSSNKLFEYLASGKPVISTAKMGYSIINKYNCGIELENNTPEELAREIIQFKQMSEQEYLQYSTNARNAAKHFDFQILTKSLIKIIEK